MFLLAQATAGPPVPRELRALVPTVAAPCRNTTEDGEIVVCARRREEPTLARLPEPPPPDPTSALSFRLPGGGTGRLHAIQSSLPGASGQGAAVTLTLPFGKGKK